MTFKKLIFSLGLMMATSQSQSAWGSFLYQEACRLMQRSRQAATVIGVGTLIAIYLWHSTRTDDDSDNDSIDTTDTYVDIDEILYQNNPLATDVQSDSDESDAHSITDTSRSLKIVEPLIFETRTDSADLPPVAFPLGWNTYPCFINNKTTNSLHVLPNSEQSIKLLDDLNNFKIFYFNNTNQFLILKTDADHRVTQLFLYHEFGLTKEVNITSSYGHFPNLNQIEAIQITHYGDQITIFTIDDKIINFSLNQ